MDIRDKSMQWCASAPGKTFEDEEGLVVYFSQGSGSTHLITEVAAFILEVLAMGPATTDELLHQIAIGADDITEQELQESVHELLEELQASELIEAA
ncbi:HPr-rel-A system PqqD family peptide chaperone [Halieaceae bacterium IMCC14734]|uniref:HPr-rel-A system PqqD family peptide chaperone n=1 Tax=Candidatus Litorirhabdus singularis TaxID=2518993 RepID=A0ABT3TF86_9GAMM|nr:HPr-rel-A system PqqD family peptide chaperone [Candidatus Litorirhabdus singularis]MCX2980958.1 HPr-rel-A system PqqD family peptide chaperone [Candidatus Litorirhabdus singularis]